MCPCIPDSICKTHTKNPPQPRLSACKCKLLCLTIPIVKRICALLLSLTACIANTADAATAVPSGTTSITIYNSVDDLPAGGKINITSPVYVGYTESFAASFAEFLENIHAISDPNAIVGIDSKTPETNRTVSDEINLSLINGFAQTTPYYIGTTSNITLTGAIIPTIARGDDYGALHFAALGDGYLKVSSQLGSTSPVNAVVIGRSDLTGQGTVELAGSNSYGGGTRVLGGTLFVSNNNALGTGAIAVSSGGTLKLGASSSITVGNPFVFEAGSTITGYGNFNSLVTLDTGVTLIPGDFGRIGEIHFHSPGTSLTVMPGSIWHIDLSATSSDLLCAWNNVDILGDRNVPVIIYLYSVNSSGFGPVVNFDPNQYYKWMILSRGNSITGFDPDYFLINADAFFSQNPDLFGLGEFGIMQDGNSLFITFTPVPEPGTYALMLLGLVTMGIAKYRRRKKV